MKLSKSFMNFAENVVESLEAVANKIDEVQAKMDELQDKIDGSGESSEPAPTETPVVEEEVKVSDEPKGSDEPAPAAEEPKEEVKEEVVEEKPEEFSEGFIVVKNLVAPYGNKVIKAAEFSEKNHQKVFNKTFSTLTQAQAMMSLYTIDGKNFSNRYRGVKNMFNL